MVSKLCNKTETFIVWFSFAQYNNNNWCLILHHKLFARIIFRTLLKFAHPALREFQYCANINTSKVYEIVIKLNSTCPMIHSSIINVDIYGNIANMTLYSIQWQASHGNWSCYANKPTMQIIKNLHSMTCCYGQLHH